MKKHLSLLLLLLVGCIPMFAAVETLHTMEFGSAYNSKKVSGYTATTTFDVTEAGNSSNKWTVTGFNNNNNSWEYAKCIGKSGSGYNTATVKSLFAIEYPVTEIVVNASKITEGGGTMTVYGSTSPTVSNTSTKLGTFELSVLTTTPTDYTIALTGAEANMFYYIEINGTNSNSKTNGALSVYTIEYCGEKGQQLLNFNWGG